MEKIIFKSRSIRMSEKLIAVIKEIKKNDQKGSSFNSIVIDCIIEGLKSKYNIKL
jgi:hypothetical protein